MHRYLLMFCVLAWTVSPGLSQVPANTEYLALFGAHALANSSLIGLDAGGATTTVQPLGSPLIGRIAVVPGRDAVLIWDKSAVHRYDFASGAFTQTSLNSLLKATTWGFVDEDGGMVWGESFGAVHKADDLRGTNTRTFRPNNRNIGTLGAWDGSTGHYVIAQEGIATFLNTIFFHDRNFALVTSIANPTGISGLDWSPWSGGLIVTRTRTPYVMRLTSQGVLTTLPTTLPRGPGTVRVRHQPVERLLTADLSVPGQVMHWVVGGAVSTLATVPGRIWDVVALDDRTLWTASPWRAGGLGSLAVNFGASHAGDFYQAALSFGFAPGIPLGAPGTVHLQLDPLFLLSLAGVPGIFSDFAGSLDSKGRSIRMPTTFISPALRGLRIYAGAVAYNRTGITAVSNCWGTTLQ